MELKQRILKGISFFRVVGEKRYDANQVKQYLPKFLDMVEEYITGKKEDLVEKAEELWGKK